MNTAGIRTGVLTALAVCGIALLVWQARRITQLGAENRRLRAQVAELAAARQAAARLASPQPELGDLLSYGSRQPTKITIEGTSTIHDWKVVGNIVIGSFDVEPAFQTDKTLKSVASLQGKGKCPRVQISIPVRSLHSTVAIGADKMDAIMQEAMRTTANPRINYKLTAIAVSGTVPEAGTPVKFNTTGELAVAGVTNQIEMLVTMERLDSDVLRFTGSKGLKMTNFRIQPPSPSLSAGMIKTGDDVTVSFEWTVGLKKPEHK